MKGEGRIRRNIYSSIIQFHISLNNMKQNKADCNQDIAKSKKKFFLKEHKIGVLGASHPFSTNN